jgi:hypothetical protein
MSIHNDLTCIYYTSNREYEIFESKIRKTLLDTIGDIPLISVSQKPVDFGINICVGDVGISKQNAFRQLLIGAMEAKTKFICTAESDYLYPKERFEIIPERTDTIYVGYPLYVLLLNSSIPRQYYLKPNGSEGAIIAGRDTIISNIQTMLKGHDEWCSVDKELEHISHISRKERIFYKTAIIQFKTPNNMHIGTPFQRHRNYENLPYWGNSIELIGKYYDNI